MAEAPKSPIPSGALDQHIAVLGKTRSGKSTVLRGFVEDLLDREKPVCIIDPKGDWWGLKLARDGKGPGYPVVIFGGPHADVPINEHAGAHVAELFATGNRPCLIDLKGWMPGERTRFWVAFASTLFRHTKGQRWLAVDEIHNFAPKGTRLDPESAKALHWANRLASEGLGMGIAMLFASQRPQKVHNDLLTSAETLIAMRVLHPSDREAIADWIKGCGDPALGAKVLGTLAQMDRGEGWAWSPEIGFGPERVKFPMFRTYDSFRPQTAQDAKGLKGWAEVDLEEVKAKLADVVEQAEANDPARLRKTIAELQKQLAKAPAAHASDGSLAELRQAHERMAGMAEESRRVVAQNLSLRKRLEAAVEAVRKVDEVVGGFRHDIEDSAREALHGRVPVADVAPPVAKVTEPRRPPPAAAPKSPAGNGHTPPKGATEGIAGVLQRILDALAELEAIGANEPPRILVANLSGYGNARSAGFVKALGGAHTAGYLEYSAGGTVRLTGSGRALANAPAAPLSRADLHRRIKSHLGGPGQKILDAVIAAHPGGIARGDLAAEAGYQNARSSGFVKALGQLRTFGFIDYRQGEVVAQPVLFMSRR